MPFPHQRTSWFSLCSPPGHPVQCRGPHWTPVNFSSSSLIPVLFLFLFHAIAHSSVTLKPLYLSYIDQKINYHMKTDASWLPFLQVVSSYSSRIFYPFLNPYLTWPYPFTALQALQYVFPTQSQTIYNHSVNNVHLTTLPSLWKRLERGGTRKSRVRRNKNKSLKHKLSFYFSPSWQHTASWSQRNITHAC